ncbi:MAG: hypothetical protein CVV25_07305 [Ignavibacteriae bacterium HGW-Ignavibacteriae-4]|jgi:class 3 adenylate cyclase/Tfp pilus assembly protein PilF|nr:MAG: hypothetical protein CVV25_07305 [Ignavibacteriae bacterium HGW-Ignavibacteriae-4]
MKTLLLILLAQTITSLYLKAEPLSGQARLDSLLAELPKAKGDTNEVKLLANISSETSSYNPEKGIKYGLRGVELSMELGWKEGEANSYTHIGICEMIQSNHLKALDYYNKSLQINEEIGNKDGEALALGNIGIVYKELSDYPKALEYYFKALKINEEIRNKPQISRNLGNIGVIYALQEEIPKSIEYIQKSLEMDKEIGNKIGVAHALANIGNIYNTESDYPMALKYYQKASLAYEEIGELRGEALVLGNMGVVYLDQSNYHKALESLKKSISLNKEIGDDLALAYSFARLGDLYLNFTLDTLAPIVTNESQLIGLNKEINLNKSIEYYSKAATIFDELNALAFLFDVYDGLYLVYELKGDYKKSLSYYKKFKEIQDSVYSQEKNDKIAALEKAREDDVNRIKIEKQEVQLAAQESEKMFIIYSGIGIIAFVISILALIAYQRKKSDQLLYNVLPISIAKRLKKKEHPISDHFEQASIIFIDIVGFTAMSKDSDPTDIVQALNKVFTHYDSIASKHGLEKIKTIGDCYMAAAGIPAIQENNTLRAARMAIEVKDYMVDYITDHGFKLDVRIGLDCGPVVAGVIGEKKFIYDMWSDAVNTASRMESTGQSGSVHVSERFKSAVTEYEEFEFVERGEIEIKGKGKMKTFFMGSKIPSHIEAT